MVLLGLALDDPQPLLDELTGELVDTWKESFGSRIGVGAVTTAVRAIFCQANMFRPFRKA